MADIIFLVLLVLHIGTVVAWMGGALLFVSVVSPSLRNMSPGSRGEFMASAIPRYVNFASGTSAMAIVTGLVLYWYFTQGVPSLAPSDAGLVSIQVGALLGLIALIVMFGVSRRSSMRLVSMMKRMAAGPNDSLRGQVSRLQRTSAMSGLVGVALLGLSLILMVVGAEL